MSGTVTGVSTGTPVRPPWTVAWNRRPSVPICIRRISTGRCRPRRRRTRPRWPGGAPRARDPGGAAQEAATRPDGAGQQGACGCCRCRRQRLGRAALQRLAPLEEPREAAGADDSPRAAAGVRGGEEAAAAGAHEGDHGEPPGRGSGAAGGGGAAGVGHAERRAAEPQLRNADVLRRRPASPAARGGARARPPHAAPGGAPPGRSPLARPPCT